MNPDTYFHLVVVFAVSFSEPEQEKAEIEERAKAALKPFLVNLLGQKNGPFYTYSCNKNASEVFDALKAVSTKLRVFVMPRTQNEPWLCYPVELSGKIGGLVDRSTLDATGLRISDFFQNT